MHKTFVFYDVNSVVYTYNANKLKLTETDGVMSNLSQTFAYDFEDRLTSWTSNGTVLNQTQSWTLSLEGAWSSNTVNSVTESRTFNQAYETLTSNSNPMLHDRKGNLTQNKDGSVYQFDFDNLMKSSSNASSISASYTYDALGRRVSKSSGNKVTVYVNSGYQILTEYVSISSSPFTENQSFVYATYIDEPIALINSNGVFYYHSNSQFSIGAMTDSLGNLSERYGYNAYGKKVTILDSILIDNPYYFTGRQLDTETNLFYFRARYYDAVLGQFISRDPIGYVDGMNLYKGYFNPNKTDYSGLDDIRVIPGTSNVQYMPTLFGFDLTKKAGTFGTVDPNGVVHFTVNDNYGNPLGDISLLELESNGSYSTFYEMIENVSYTLATRDCAQIATEIRKTKAGQLVAMEMYLTNEWPENTVIRGDAASGRADTPLGTEFESRWSTKFGLAGMTTFVPVVVYSTLFGDGAISGKGLSEMVRHTMFLEELNVLYNSNDCKKYEKSTASLLNGTIDFVDQNVSIEVVGRATQGCE